MIGARPLWTLDLPDYAPDVRFSPDGRLLAAPTVRGPVVVIHRASNGEIRARASLGRGWVDKLAWSPDGSMLAAAMGRALCFLAPDGSVRGRYDGHPSTVTGLAWHRERGAWITSAYGVVSLVSAGEPEPLTTHYFRTSLLSVHPSPDGRFVASGTQDPLVHVWDLDDETNEVNLTGYAGKVAVLGWSPVSPLLATGAGSGLVIWDFAGGDPFRSSPREMALGASGRVTAIEFLRTGHLVAGTDAGVVWALTLGRDGGERDRAILARVSGEVCGLVPSPDGRALAVVAAGGGMALLSLADSA